MQRPAAKRGSSSGARARALWLLSVLLCAPSAARAQSVSIKPADFDRLIMPCYLGGGSVASVPMAAAYAGAGPSQASMSQSQQAGYSNMLGRSGPNNNQLLNNPNNLNNNNNGYQGAQAGLGAEPMGRMGARDSMSMLGQQVPRASSMDNFIALVSKIESLNPRLAANPDQLIKSLLGRFRMDSYYYDTRSRTPIIDQDHRNDIIPALFSQSIGFGQQVQAQFMLTSDVFPENLLDHDEKCSMYFMLSHFIDKVSPLNPALGEIRPAQMSGPQSGQKSPMLQAAGVPYPAQSADRAYNGAGGSRYPGPAPSFGSPATNNMNSFGAGLSNNPDYSGKNPYGSNVLQPNPQFSPQYNQQRQSGQFPAGALGSSRFVTPFLDGGGGRNKDERQALEFGVVTVANQDNAAVVLNRVLLGLLAANTPPQSIRQLSASIYPTQPTSNTPKMDEEIDPLFAVTLADLWAISSIAKSGKPFDVRLLGGNGRWNDSMCPTSFQLERSSSIRFTTAELLGGLDGFNLGNLRRRMQGKPMKLSELLKIYYSRNGFRPQFAEVGVCNRASGINSHLDDLHRQAENYLRLYQLNTPINDGEIAMSINRLEAFREILRQSASQLAPAELCQEASYNEVYPLNTQAQCEIGKADVVAVVDTSPQANTAFMNMAVTKLAQRLGLSRYGNTLSVLTNQQDTTGYAGAYSFNAIVRNSSNTAEIGCSLTYDTTRTYQGGQITDPTRLVEMFERALINIDSEYLIRQTTVVSSSSLGSYMSSNKPTSFISSMIGQTSDNYYTTNGAPQNSGGAKVIIWFNYGQSMRVASPGSGPTSWQGSSMSTDQQNSQYRFIEAKKFLRENFRGASLLAVATNREDVKQFVFDEERDIFTDIPASGGSNDYYQQLPDTSGQASIVGPADQLINKLMQRMCETPAIFQYPMCFRGPSENTAAVGYISPGRRQYWMMSPKTFFASQTVRLAFKVDGGRLRVCFGRMPRPDESANRRGQQYPMGSINIGGMPVNQAYGAQSTPSPSSSSDYYTGLEYGVCKDVSQGQEIDFVVSQPCWHKSIAECEPFYFTITEISNPGEVDMNYMCKDEGCKRFDQARFTLAHSGVACSSAFKTVQSNMLLIILATLGAMKLTTQSSATFGLGSLGRRLVASSGRGYALLMLLIISALHLVTQQAAAQLSGVYDYGQGRYGEKRGNFTPSEVLAIVLLIMTLLVGLAFTIGLCYYVHKRESRGKKRAERY